MPCADRTGRLLLLTALLAGAALPVVAAAPAKPGIVAAPTVVAGQGLPGALTGPGGGMEAAPSPPPGSGGRRVEVRTGVAEQDPLAGVPGPAAALAAAPAQPDPAAPEPSARRVTVFLSRALGEQALREAFRAAAGRADTVVVFRGLAEGERLRDFVRAVAQWTAGIEPPPAVQLDPLAFRAGAVTTVPEIQVTEGGIELARVRGLTDPGWLLARIAAGARGDLGPQGPTVAVLEPDLIETLQRRLAALDLAQLRERALARFWTRADFVVLPEASAPRERRIDPSVVAGRDLLLPDGTLLVRAGERLNPLAHLPLTRRLVVFDATRPAQVAAARRLGQVSGAPVTYLATRLPRAEGWEALRRIEDTLAAPVYLLSAALRERLALERVPAEARAEGPLLVVREVVP